MFSDPQLIAIIERGSHYEDEALERIGMSGLGGKCVVCGASLKYVAVTQHGSMGLDCYSKLKGWPKQRAGSVVARIAKSLRYTRERMRQRSSCLKSVRIYKHNSEFSAASLQLSNWAASSGTDLIETKMVPVLEAMVRGFAMEQGVACPGGVKFEVEY